MGDFVPDFCWYGPNLVQTKQATVRITSRNRCYYFAKLPSIVLPRDTVDVQTFTAEFGVYHLLFRASCTLAPCAGEKRPHPIQPYGLTAFERNKHL
eukprot:2390268-Amphidinium_carterae.1